MDNSKLHIAIISSPGMGHLIPALVLANRLATHHNIKTTILVITTTSSPPSSQLLKFPEKEEQNLVEIISLPPVDISHLINPTTKLVTQIFMMVRAALPAIRTTIAAMKHRPAAIVSDLFCTSAFPIAEEFNLPKYLYITCNARYTAITVYVPVLDKEIKGEYVDQIEPFEIPGCEPVRPEDVLDPMLDRNDQEYLEYVQQGVEFGLSDGILLNTWEDLEQTSLKALRENEILKNLVKAPVYTVGPLRRPVEPASSKSEVVEWLDMQPSNSVMYVSFGSGGTLTGQQINELAYGLELSQQRFIWVVRPPVDGGVTNGAFFDSGKSDSDGSQPDYLPEGFATRTGQVGLVITGWAEQVEILNHPSVGGFLSHCGWNSVLESICSGVPMIAWPLYAEQRTNATLITEEFGIAVRPEVLPTKKVVDRFEIEKLVRRVMEDKKEGKGTRDRVVKYKASAESALSEGGSSYNSTCDFLKDIEMRLQS